MTGLLGDDPLVFLGLTCVLFGGAGFLMGQALARNWKPLWQLGLYSVGLTIFNRFLVYALFDGDALSLPGFLLDLAVIVLIALFAYRVTRAHAMVSQYPWLYERSGLMRWRERKEG